MYLFSKKNQTGKRYFYLGENKKINGRSVRIKEIYLGSADRINELIHSKRHLEKINTYEYGLTIALLQIIGESGLYKILKDIIGFNIRGVPGSIIVIIILLNKIINPKSKNGLKNWYRNSVVSRILPLQSSKLTSQIFFDCLRELNEKKINRIEYRMAKEVNKMETIESIICDMTQIETYIQHHEGNQLPQRGYLKSKSGRRIVNIALMISRENSIPLFHITYPGNINVPTEFVEVIKILENRYNLLTGHGKKRITIMIDKGNNSEANINRLEDAGYYFIGRLKPSSYEELLSKPLSEFKDQYEDTNKKIKSYSIFKEVYSRRRKLVIKFTKDSFDKSYEEFMELIERRENAIKDLQKNINYKLKYGSNQSKLYWQKKEKVENAILRIIDKNPTKNLFSYHLKHNKNKMEVQLTINKNEYNKRINLIGKYILFTNRKRWSHNKIIKAFLDQYLIEHQYKTLKSDRIKIAPLNHWTDDSIRADIFLSILSLQIMNLLLLKVRKQKKIDFSNNNILDTLQRIKTSYYKLENSEHEFDLINELDESQKLLFDKLNLKDKNTFSYIKRAFS